MKRLLVELSTILGFLLIFAVQNTMASSIKIDGKFNDWEDVPKSTWTTSAKPSAVAMIHQNDGFYFLVDINPKLTNGYTTYQPAGYVLSVGKWTYYITLSVNPWELQTGKTKKGTVNVWGTSTSGATYWNSSTGKLAVTRKRMGKDRTDDAFEWYIPDSAFKDAEQEATSSTKWTFNNRNLNDGEGITYQGASTGPYMLAAAGFVLAGVGFFVPKYVRRRHEKA